MLRLFMLAVVSAVALGTAIGAAAISAPGETGSSGSEGLSCVNLTNINDPRLEPALALMHGFVLGVNAAEPELVSDEQWQAFAGAVYGTCFDNPDASVSRALHEALRVITTLR